jgi:hypothetical protein
MVTMAGERRRYNVLIHSADFSRFGSLIQVVVP